MDFMLWKIKINKFPFLSSCKRLDNIAGCVLLSEEDCSGHRALNGPELQAAVEDCPLEGGCL